MSETNTIVKQVQIDSSTHEIGAKYDEAENPIRGTYGASLNLPIETEATGGTSIQLVAKDNTLLSTVNLELDASVISDGILPVEFGGTGITSLTENSVLIAGDDTVDEVTPTAAGGAFYAPADSAQQNPSPQTPVFGTLPVAYGGTGSTTMTHNGVLVGTVVTNNNETSSYARYIENQSGLGGAFYAPADPSSSENKAAQTPVFGTLPVAYGGTGITAVSNVNAVVIGNNASTAGPLQTVGTSSGAFYATESNGTPVFGVLPIAQGGTGAQSFTNNAVIYKGSSGLASTGVNIDSIKFLSQTSGGAPTWTSVDISTELNNLASNIATSYATTLVKGLIPNTQDEENGTLVLKNGNSQTLSTVSIADATYLKHGLMSASDKQKLDEFYLANAYATTAYVDQLISEHTDITVYKGVVSFDSTDNRWESDNGTVWPPASPQNGWTYKVGTQGIPTGMSETCYVGDFLIYSTSGGAHWARIGGSNSEGSLYKKSPYTAGQMLLADDNLGAVKSVDIAPTVTLDTPSASVGQTITISVGGQPGTLQQSATLGQATTSVYGVTKLTSTASKNSLDADSLAVTPAGVYNILRNDVVAPVTNTYTLLPSTSSETANNTDTFKWQYDSTNDYYYVTIQSPNITANSYEFVTTADSVNTSLAEIAALQTAAIVPGAQTRQDGAGYGTFLLIAKGTVPSIITHIRVTHNYSSAELDAADSTAAQYASAAELAAASAHNMMHRAITISSTVADSLNFGYPYKYVVDWSGVKESDWIDGTGVTDQDWTIEALTNQVILHFTNPITSNTLVHLYWAPCNEYAVEGGEDI